MKKYVATVVAGLLALVPAVGCAIDLAGLQDDWAHIKYETPVDARVDAMTKLKATADGAAAAQPNSVELMIWDGIITASLAGLRSGPGALSLAKEARNILERAEKRSPGALRGSALITLGALYYQVPGWPVGFGDRDKARSNLERALEIDPVGIDPNYFHADLLFREGDYAAAKAVALRALAAPPRPGREVADMGRRGEIRDLLSRIEAMTAD